MTAAELAVRLNANTTPHGWEAHCPAHEDERASLTLAEGREGRVLVRCHAGCSAEQIVAALGLTLADLFENGRLDDGAIAATYDYTDDAGALLLKTEIGIGVLLDRDLSAFLERLTDVRGRTVERLLGEVAQGAEAQAMLQGKTVPVASISAAGVPSRFGFVARPAPRAGEPEC